jgi:hypothetical protein
MADEKDHKPTEHTKAKATENAKKTVTESSRDVRSVQEAQRAAMAKGKPTPTQEENDIACSGGYPELAEDGSGPDQPLARAMEAGKSGGYATRQSTASSAERAPAPAHQAAPASRPRE